MRYVNDITVQKRPLSAIDDLHSYEHVMIHEWLHNRKTDVGSLQVTDLKGDYGDGPRNIYGSYACHHYAWRNVLKGGGVGDISSEAMKNADSFAWMISYKWYEDLMGWQDDGSLKPVIQLKKRDDDPKASDGPYSALPLDPDAVEDTTVAEDEGSSMPETTTYYRNDCPSCLIIEGGCNAA